MAKKKAKDVVSECYTIGVDIRENEDLSVFVTVKRDGDVCKVLHTYTGEEAERKYKKFIKEFCSPPTKV